MKRVAAFLLMASFAASQVPAGVSVHRTGIMKSCADFARFVAIAAPTERMAEASSGWQEGMNCAAAPKLPADAPLELAQTKWNPALHRWEFALHCGRPEDCVPFLLWSREEDLSRAGLINASPAVRALTLVGNAGGRLVKRGQTTTLIWDQAGIRVALPVTCLEGGGVGQWVRVQLKNTSKIVRAEVLSDGTLRASL